MEDKIGDLICERSDDLISFLYQELDEREVRNFKQHLADCASCSRELNSFSEIRNGVVAWREQSLGIINHRPSLAFSFAEKPSALAAIRQFFALSPLWLKGSVAFASVLLFAAVAFLVVSLKAKPAAPLASTDKVYSEAELKAKVEEGIQARLKELNPQDDGRERRIDANAIAGPAVKAKGKVIEIQCENSTSSFNRIRAGSNSLLTYG